MAVQPLSLGGGEDREMGCGKLVAFLVDVDGGKSFHGHVVSSGPPSNPQAGAAVNAGLERPGAKESCYGVAL